MLGNDNGLLSELIGGNIDGEPIDLKPSVRAPVFAFPDVCAHPMRLDTEAMFKDGCQYVTRRTTRTVWERPIALVRYR